MSRFILIFGALLLQMPVWAQEELTIAAAADLQSVMKEVAARFEKQTGSRVKLSFGSSGNFFAQIQNGAPYDLFLSADLSYPARLEADGLTEPGSLYPYAVGRIVLWVPNRSTIDLAKGLKAVIDPALKKLDIANPAHAPYGRAAEAALKNAHVWEEVSAKLVLGENISQTAQFVQSGNADAGILALSLALAPAMRSQGRYFEIPQESYPRLQQAAVILRSAKHKELARRYLAFLKSEEIKSLLKGYGFATEPAV